MRPRPFGEGTNGIGPGLREPSVPSSRAKPTPAAAAAFRLFLSGCWRMCELVPSWQQVEDGHSVSSFLCFGSAIGEDLSYGIRNRSLSGSLSESLSEIAGKG
jgi:hypothetical protein